MTADQAGTAATSGGPDGRTAVVQIAEDILTQHIRIERIMCRATSLGPITVKHSLGREPSPVVLHCSEQAHGPETPHRDAIHCWTFHRFTADQATPPVNRDESHCSCGRGSWPTADPTQHHFHPCDAATLALAVIAERGDA